MFCAAQSAPVTMCTLASSRTPDMPIGSRMPSWPSTMNSCGSTCRIFWSAGMATALAASITCSTSPWRHLLVADADHAVGVQAAHVAAGDAGIHRVDLAAGHELGFLHRALDRLHGGLDVDHHALLQSARGLRAEAEELDRAVGLDFAHQRHDLGGADVESDDQIAFRSLSHRVDVTLVPSACWHGGARRVQPMAKPLV